MRKSLMFYCALVTAPAAIGANWYPVSVIADNAAFKYVPLTSTSKVWRVCALLPQGQDKFWWGVSWGLVEQAKQVNVKLGIYEAGGYDHLDVQRQQFADCVTMKADAIIVSAVSSTGLNDQVQEAIGRGVVVVDLLNGIAGTATARSAGDTGELTRLAYEYIKKDSSAHPLSILWFPGPAKSDWVTRADIGLREAVKRDDVRIIDGGYDVTEPTRQMTLMRSKLAQSKPDYVLANSVAAISAARLIKRGDGSRPKIVAWYANEQVVAAIKQGDVLAAVSSNPVVQARIGLDLALRALEKKPYSLHVKVLPDMLDRSNIAAFATDKLYAPAGQWIKLQKLPD